MDQAEQQRAAKLEMTVALLNIALVALSLRLISILRLVLTTAGFVWAAHDRTWVGVADAAVLALGVHLSLFERNDHGT